MLEMRSRGFLQHYASGEGRRFLTLQAWWLAATALALLGIFALGDLDREIARGFFDAARHEFPLADDWWLKTVLHDAARTASALAALAVLAVGGVAWLAPRLERTHSLRHELAFTAAAALLSAVLVATLKHFSAHACPWDLAEFGGTAPYHRLLSGPEALPPIEGCFPAAHPLVGYAWLCVGFALYPRAPRVALVSMGAALLTGTAAGAVQVMRGAHFLSHVLWTAWTVWALDVALLWLWRARAKLPSVAWGILPPDHVD
jgi:membrane-associated PAP2 superfamily phosphatase